MAVSEVYELYYEDLGLQGGAEASKITQAEIRKAYRAKALLCHPDKRPDDRAVAEAEFNKLRKAYDVLKDDKAREAYDQWLGLRRAKAEKEGKQSAKRQKMMAELRERERNFEVEQQRRRAESATAQRLKAEIARVRAAQSLKSMSGGKGMMFKEGVKAASSVREGAKAQSSAAEEDRDRMIKVSWNCSEGGAGGYTASRLREVFGQFGAVEDVVIGPRKSRRKGSALLVMGSKDAAVLATQTDCGDFSSPFSVVLAQSKADEPVAAGSQYLDSCVAEVANFVGSVYHQYEDTTLLKLRQAAERARLIKELEREDREQKT